MRRFLVLALAVVLGAPFAVANHASSAQPQRLRLPDQALVGLVGGVGAAITDIQLPGQLVSTTPYSGISWNKPGARCQFSCNGTSALDAKPSNQGYDARAPYIVLLPSLGVPALEVYGDGVLKSHVDATFITTQGGFNVYQASLATKCVHGATPGAVCNGTNVCSDSTHRDGECRVCDQNGSCATDANPAPCAKTCSGGDNAGKSCTANTDCPYAPSPGYYFTCQLNSFGTNAQTCYALSSCGSGGNGCTDCRDTGVGLTSGASGHNRFLHTVVTRVLAGSAELGRSERVIQVVTGDSNDPATLCSGNCNGAADVAGCVGTSCTFPPNCG